MVTYLEDAVKITPEIIELLCLVYSAEKKNLSQTAIKLDIHKSTLHRILKGEDRRRQLHEQHYHQSKQIHEYQVQNAVDYLKEHGQSEHDLCQLLGVGNLEEAFFPVRVSQQAALLHQVSQYLKRKEISRTEFFKQVKTAYPDLITIAENSFHDLFEGRTKIAGLSLLTALKEFFEKNDPDQLPELPAVDYHQVMLLADKYLKKKKITSYALAKLIHQHNPSVGALNTVREWLKRRTKPKHPEKLRIVKSYFDKVESLSKVKLHSNIDILYHALYPEGNLDEIAARTNLDGASPKEYAKRLSAQLEQEIINYHQKDGKTDLARSVLLNVFGRDFCPRIKKFSEWFPNLTAYLESTNDAALIFIFEEILSSVPVEDLYTIAERYLKPNKNPDKIKPHLGILVEELKLRIEALEKISQGSSQLRDDEKLRTTFKLERGIQIRRTDLEYQIMKKLDPNYWPSHKKI